MTQIAPFSATPNWPDRIAKSTAAKACGSSTEFGSKFGWPAPGTSDTICFADVYAGISSKRAIDFVEIGDRNRAAADRFDHRGKLPPAIGIRDPSIIELRQRGRRGLVGPHKIREWFAYFPWRSRYASG